VSFSPNGFFSSNYRDLPRRMTDDRRGADGSTSGWYTERDLRLWP